MEAVFTPPVNRKDHRYDLAMLARFKVNNIANYLVDVHISGVNGHPEANQNRLFLQTIVYIKNNIKW